MDLVENMAMVGELANFKVEHVGGINGFHTYLGRYLDDQVTIILLSNIETEDIDPIVTGMEKIIFNQN